MMCVVYVGKPLRLGHLKVFGCQAYTHVPKDKSGKLGPRVEWGIFLGIMMLLKNIRSTIYNHGKLLSQRIWSLVNMSWECPT